MTQAAYTDINLGFTLKAAADTPTTFPTQEDVTQDITNLYKEAAEHRGETYAAGTVPDTPTLFSQIVNIVRGYWITVLEARKNKQNLQNIARPQFTEREIQEHSITKKHGQTWIYQKG